MVKKTKKNKKGVGGRSKTPPRRNMLPVKRSRSRTPPRRRSHNSPSMRRSIRRSRKRSPSPSPVNSSRRKKKTRRLIRKSISPKTPHLSQKRHMAKKTTPPFQAPLPDVDEIKFVDGTNKLMAQILSLADFAHDLKRTKNVSSNDVKNKILLKARLAIRAILEKITKKQKILKMFPDAKNFYGKVLGQPFENRISDLVKNYVLSKGRVEFIQEHPPLIALPSTLQNCGQGALRIILDSASIDSRFMCIVDATSDQARKIDRGFFTTPIVKPEITLGEFLIDKGITHIVGTKLLEMQAIPLNMLNARQLKFLSKNLDPEISESIKNFFSLHNIAPYVEGGITRTQNIYVGSASDYNKIESRKKKFTMDIPYSDPSDGSINNEIEVLIESNQNVHKMIIDGTEFTKSKSAQEMTDEAIEHFHTCPVCNLDNNLFCKEMIKIALSKGMGDTSYRGDFHTLTSAPTGFITGDNLCRYFILLYLDELFDRNGRHQGYIPDKHDGKLGYWVIPGSFISEIDLRKQMRTNATQRYLENSVRTYQRAQDNADNLFKSQGKLSLRKKDGQTILSTHRLPPGWSGPGLESNANTALHFLDTFREGGSVVTTPEADKKFTFPRKKD